jgi:hypothetical protein
MCRPSSLAGIHWTPILSTSPGQYNWQFAQSQSRYHSNPCLEWAFVRLPSMVRPRFAYGAGGYALLLEFQENDFRI